MCAGATASEAQLSTPALIADADLARVHAVLSNGGAKFNLGGRYSMAEHLAHVSVFAAHLRPLLAPGDRVIDLGAGSGILGFVYASRPSLHCATH